MTERFLISNGLIVTGDENRTIIPKGHILVEDNKIIEISSEKPKGEYDTSIDASGCVVIPGLITAHTHLYGILLRGASLNIEPPTDFAQILQRVWWPVDEALTIEDAYASSLSASADMLRNGSTFFADTYSGPNSIEGSLKATAKGANSVGIRSMLSFEITERNSPEEAERGLREGKKFAKSVKTDSLVSCMMSIHASFTVDDDIVSRTSATADELEIPLTIHTSEGAVDLYHNLERYGERTVERLARLGVLKPRTVLAHCVHVNDTELDLIADHGASVAHNPMSNMLNGVGTAPVPDMLMRDITVGLGNDGWIYDPFENMRCALTVHRLDRSNPGVIGPEQVFKMATIDGAKCYGIECQIGSLEVGKLADIVILDGERIPTPLTESSVIGHIINSFGGRDVRDVVVNGKKVLENKKLTLISEKQVAEISRKSAEGLWAELD